MRFWAGMLDLSDCQSLGLLVVWRRLEKLGEHSFSIQCWVGEKAVMASCGVMMGARYSLLSST